MQQTCLHWLKNAGPPRDEELLSSSPIKSRAEQKYASNVFSKNYESVFPQCVRAKRFLFLLTIG